MPAPGPVPSIASHQLVVLLTHLTPSVSAWLLPHDPVQIHLLDAVAQVGLLLLVGITGIQVDLGLIRRRAGTAVSTGIAGLVIPLAAGTGLALLLPASLIPAHASRTTFAAFVGVAVGVSAIPVIAKTLTDMRLLHRDIGQLILCAVSVDGTLGWVLLAIVSAIAAGHLAATGVWRLLGGFALVIVVAVACRPLVRAGLARIDASAEETMRESIYGDDAVPSPQTACDRTAIADQVQLRHRVN